MQFFCSSRLGLTAMVQNSTSETDEDRNLVLDYRILQSKVKILEEILESQRMC